MYEPKTFVTARYAHTHTHRTFSKIEENTKIGERLFLLVCLKKLPIKVVFFVVHNHLLNLLFYI